MMLYASTLVSYTYNIVVQTCDLLMAKRGFKLFALALSILVGGSFLALVEIPQTTQHRYRRPSKTARSVEPPTWAAYLEPIVTVVGISLKDLAKQFLDARRSARSLNELKPLVDVNDAYEHAGVLANKLLEGAERSHKGQNIIVTSISLPLIPVNGTDFQHLVSNVLSDVTSTGVSSIYAEPGVGKSVAVVLAMLGWAEGNPNSITVLIQENLKLLNDFFRVNDEAYIPAVAANLFRILSDAGVRLQLVLDNVFDDQLGEDGKMLMSLARAAFKYGQVVVVTQSREVAEEVGSLNGARTRVSSQQKCDVSEYRWNEMQAIIQRICRVILLPSKIVNFHLWNVGKADVWQKAEPIHWFSCCVCYARVCVALGFNGFNSQYHGAFSFGQWRRWTQQSQCIKTFASEQRLWRSAHGSHQKPMSF